MINKRLLIKNLLTHNDENSFYDKKEKLSLSSKEGKAKFIKHICALSNSNPENNSFIVIGIEDEENQIMGVDFFDDSKIQNLVNAYLKNPPKITYENVPFPTLPHYKVIGLVTIHPNNEVSSLVKNAWKYPKGTIFLRQGSNSMPVDTLSQPKNSNQKIVEGIEKNSVNSIDTILSGVFDFFNRHKKEHKPQYKVFKEQHVLCWAGKKQIIGNETFYSRVDIELINENVKFFYSTLDEVKIVYNENYFEITEYILLGLDANKKHYPLEKRTIYFTDSGDYNFDGEFLFKAPQYNKQLVQLTYNNNNSIVNKIEKGIPLSVTEHEDVYRLPTSYLICYLHGFVDAKEQLEKAKNYIRNLSDKTTYIRYKDVIRVLRKVKYN